MKKGFLTLTTAAVIFCSAGYADTTTTGTTTGTGTTSTSGGMTDSTMTTDSHVDIQLKTSDGRMFNVSIHPQDMKGLKEGDSLTISSLTDQSLSTTPSTTSTTTTTPMTDTTSSGSSSAGSSSGSSTGMGSSDGASSTTSE